MAITSYATNRPPFDPWDTNGELYENKKYEEERRRLAREMMQDQQYQAKKAVPVTPEVKPRNRKLLLTMRKK